MNAYKLDHHFNVLIQNRFSPLALFGDIKQAFLQVHIKEENRDAIHFHWLVDKDPNQIETYRFTRPLLGLVQSPFILGGTLTIHLGGYKERHLIEVDEILITLYTGDVISDGNNIPEAKHLKTTMIKIFGEANFKLHK